MEDFIFCLTYTSAIAAKFISFFIIYLAVMMLIVTVLMGFKLKGAMFWDVKRALLLYVMKCNISQKEKCNFTS